jgi:hypothetical protein
MTKIDFLIRALRGREFISRWPFPYLKISSLYKYQNGLQLFVYYDEPKPFMFDDTRRRNAEQIIQRFISDYFGDVGLELNICLIPNRGYK